MNKHFGWAILVFFIVLNSSVARSQEKIADSTTDSLHKEIRIKSRPNKASAQLELALQILNTDIHEAQKLADSALSAAKTMNDKNLEMLSYYTLGRIGVVLDNEDLTLANYERALNLADSTGDNWYKGEILYRLGAFRRNQGEEIEALELFNASIHACRLSDNFKIMGSAYSLMGTIFRVNGLYDRAIEYIVNAKLYYEKAGFSEGYAWSAYISGRIYSDLNLPKKALEYFQEAVEIYSKQAAIDGKTDGVAICFEQIGLLKLASGNYDEAFSYIDSTLKIYTLTKSVTGISNSHKNLGMIAYSMGDFELSQKYLNESLKVKTENGDLLSLPTIYEYLGLCLIGEGKIKNGFNYLQQGLDLAISNNQTKIQLNIYSELTKAYLGINDLKNAINCQKKQIEIQDLMLSGAANIKYEQLQTIYEVDKQNGQIIELEKQNQINSLLIKQHRVSQMIMIIGILIALLISIIIYLLYNKIKLKNLELKESNAAKDKFFAVIAHDLRGPVGNLASFMEHLNETFNERSPTELKQILTSLNKSAENVSSLLENLLKWAQSQLNRIEFNPRELRLKDAFQVSIKLLKQAADNKNISISLEPDDQLSVWADPDMVQTILRNLLSNAIKFTARGGKIIIRSEVADMKNVTVSITDNGVGIEKLALSKIYDITGTHHTSGTEGEKSTGLGLILVKDFIEKNNGTLTITSQKDIGTVVTFTLPAAPRHN